MARELPHLDGVTHRDVVAGGLRIHVAEAGDGPPLLLLHGWPQHWWEWRGLVPRLADRHRLIMPDLRGFGWSEAPSRGYEKEQLVDDTLALLDALDLDRVGLVGHDWGGWAGYLLCLRAPERVERYLAMNIAHPWLRTSRVIANYWRFGYQWVIATPGLGYRLIRRGTVVRKALVDGGLAPQDAEIFAAQFAEPERARATVQLYRTFVLREAPKVRPRYRHSRLTVPTLQLHGADDAVIRPSMLTGYEAHADDMRVELVPGCAHFIADQRPDLIAERALTFFAA